MWEGPTDSAIRTNTEEWTWSSLQKSMSCTECGGNHLTELCATRAPTTLRHAPPVEGRPTLGFGDRLGNYTLTRRLGGGSSSEVFLAENEVSQAVAAVKVLRPKLHEERDLVRRFQNEARITKQVRHEHVVEIYDFGLYAGWQHYIQLEYLEGVTLSHLIPRPLDMAWAGQIILQLCSALNAAHSKGVVHRDVKPSNIFVLNRDGQPYVKLMDFGMARRRELEEGEDRTRVGTIIGTAAYMSPEQAQGAEVDGRSDVYSLGVLMYRMATGRLPFESGNALAVMVAHVEQPPPPPRDLNPEISPAYEAVILRCLAKSPGHRWQTVGSLGRRIAAAIGTRPGGTAGVRGSLPGAISVPETAILGRSAPEPLDPDPSTLSESNEPRPAARREPRVRASFGVQVYGELGGLLGDAVIGDLSMGGAFVRSSMSLPLFSRVRLVGMSPSGLLEVACELVRLVLSDGPGRGFGVKFLATGPEQRLILEALTHTPSTESIEGDPHAEAQLRIFEARLGGDAYELLGVSKDAPTARIREVSQRLREELAPSQYPQLSAAQGRRLETLAERLGESEGLLVDPTRRALNDAVNGNVLGVLRCVTEGLLPERLSELRVEFLKVRPDTDELARPALLAASQAESAGDVKGALAAVADALCHDPLNLELHRRAVELRGKRSKPGDTSPGETIDED